MTGSNVNTNKYHLIKKHEFDLKTFSQNSTMQLNYQPSVFDFPVENIKLLAKNRVDIKALVSSLGGSFKGKFFLCRTLVPTYENGAIYCLVDDPFGVQVVQLALYNYRSHNLNPLPVIPVGVILAIKNPCLKLNGDNGYCIRVNDPQNVITVDDEMFIKLFPTLVWSGDVPIHYRHLSVGGGRHRSAKEWTAIGNKQMKEKNFIAAVVAYRKALSFEPENVHILTKRASAYLCLRYYYRALEDSEKILILDRTNLVGNLQHAKALCGLQRHEEAIHFIEKKQVKSREFSRLLTIVKKLQQQSETGNYDFSALYRGHEKYHENMADFVGPLEFQQRNRKVVASDNIAEGQLLMLNRAFSVIFRNKWDVDSSKSLLVKEIAQKIKFEPEWRQELCGLSHKSIDITKFSMEKIKSIVDKHSFGGMINTVIGPSETEEESVNEASGLWLLPTFLNHSCWEANSFWLTLGDIFVLRSLKPIARGQEVLIAYCDPALPIEERMESVKKRGFVCNCTLCHLDRSESQKTHKDRRRYLEGIRTCADDFDQAYVLIMQLIKLRPLQNNTPILVPCQELAEKHFSQRNFQEALNLFLQIYEVIKNSAVRHLVVDYGLKIASCFAIMNNESAERRWLENVERFAVLAYGVKDVTGLIKFRLDTVSEVCRSYKLTETLNEIEKQRLRFKFEWILLFPFMLLCFVFHYIFPTVLRH